MINDGPASLQQELNRRVTGERRTANSLFVSEDMEYKRRACAFHLGKAAALEEFAKWLDSNLDSLLARP